MAPKIRNDRPPEFFKVYLPKPGFVESKIPVDFIEYLNGSPKKAELQSRTGKVWQVKMDYTDNGVFFLDGWKKFVEENSIRRGDILFFRNDGDHRFDIKIFGISGCEKGESTGPGVGIDILDMTMEEEEEEVEEGDEKVGDDVIDVDAYHGGGTNDDNEDYDEEEKEDKEEEEATIRNRKRRGRKISGKKGGSGKRASIGTSKVLTAELNKHVQTGNPFFVTKLREDRKDVLFVPPTVLKNFGVELAKHITFRNEFGLEWAGEVVRWKDGRRWIKGWKAVCRCNNVGKDDCCICAFPQKGRVERDTIEVHIVRGGGRSSSS